MPDLQSGHRCPPPSRGVCTPCEPEERCKPVASVSPVTMSSVAPVLPAPLALPLLPLLPPHQDKTVPAFWSPSCVVGCSREAVHDHRDHFRLIRGVGISALRLTRSKIHIRATILIHPQRISPIVFQSGQTLFQTATIAAEQEATAVGLISQDVVPAVGTARRCLRHRWLNNHRLVIASFKANNSNLTVLDRLTSRVLIKRITGTNTGADCRTLLAAHSRPDSGCDEGRTNPPFPASSLGRTLVHRIESLWPTKADIGSITDEVVGYPTHLGTTTHAHELLHHVQVIRLQHHHLVAGGGVVVPPRRRRRYIPAVQNSLCLGRHDTDQEHGHDYERKQFSHGFPPLLAVTHRAKAGGFRLFKEYLNYITF